MISEIACVSHEVYYLLLLCSFKVLLSPWMSNDADFTLIFKDEELVVYSGLQETTYCAGAELVGWRVLLLEKWAAGH